jgi:type IV pilus assembly protein PilB
LPSILDLLIAQKKLTKAEQAAIDGKISDEENIQVLLSKGVITPTDLARATAEKNNIPFVDLRDFPVNPSIIALVPPELCRKYALVPIEQTGNSLTVAISNPANVIALDDVRAATKLAVKPVVATLEDIAAVINLYLRSDQEMQNLTSAIELGHVASDAPIVDHNADQNAPIVRFVNLLISQAIQDRASDIHLEPAETDLRIRFRIDGVLHETQHAPKAAQAEIISRIKVMSEMDIAERRVPQDGRMTFTFGESKRDLRVASLPTVWGEKLVLRILDSHTTNMSFEELGLQPKNLESYKRAVTKPWGMTLVTGPTGSGKTTTLYASLALVSGPQVNVITIEDPIEYRMDGINQMQVNAKAGLTFATALRSMLRADPNIMMVGEIRDRETAQIAVEAALTGHLVLSTLHTNDAPSAVTRLVELGVEPFLVSSSLDCVVAQRLARKLCEICRESFEPDAAHLLEAGFPEKLTGKATFYRAVGCEHCSQTGYRGRLAIQEVMPVTEEIESLILSRASSTEIEKQALKQGMSTLREDGFLKAAKGLTSIEEVLRVVA